MTLSSAHTVTKTYAYFHIQKANNKQRWAMFLSLCHTCFFFSFPLLQNAIYVSYIVGAFITHTLKKKIMNAYIPSEVGAFFTHAFEKHECS